MSDLVLDPRRADPLPLPSLPVTPRNVVPGLTLLLCGSSIAFLPASALAQDPAAVEPATDTVALVGEVRDAASEGPIAEASVTIEELGRIVLTDRNGLFRFDSLPAGTWTFRTERLGYEPNVEASTIGPGNLLLVRLRPRPLELEGLHAEVEARLRVRRADTGGRIWAWDREELSQVVASDVGRMIERSGGMTLIDCREGRVAEFSHMDLPTCFMDRGRERRLTILLDEAPLPQSQGGTSLWSLDPRELAAVEFVVGCGELRLYTPWFLAAVEEGRAELAPMLCMF